MVYELPRIKLKTHLNISKFRQVMEKVFKKGVQRIVILAQFQAMIMDEIPKL